MSIPFLTSGAAHSDQSLRLGWLMAVLAIPLAFAWNGAFFGVEQAQAAACVAGASGNWSNTTTVWTGCAGGGNSKPSAGDTIQVNSGVALVVDENTPTVGAITIVADAGASGTNRVAITINSGTKLTSSGLMTINGPTTTTNTTSVTLSGTGALEVGSLTFGTGATNRNITLAVGSGTLTVNGNITAGSGGTRSLTTSGAATLNWNGTTIPTGLTWTMNSFSTTNFTGTCAINGAYTFGNVDIDSGTTTLGAGTITFANITNIRDGATLQLGNFAFTQTSTINIGQGTSGILNGGTGSTGTYTFSSFIIVSAGGVFNLAASSGTHAVAFSGTGGHTHNGTTFNTGTGSVNLSSTGAFPISGNGAMTYGGTLSIPTNRQVTVSNTNTVTFGALTMASAAAVNSFTINDGSNVVVTGALTFSANASATTQLVTLGSGAGAGNLTVGSITMTGGNAGNSGGGKIQCSASGTGTLTVSGAGTITITGSSTASNTGLMSIDMSAGACNVVTGTVAGTVLTLAGGTTGASPATMFKMGTGTATLNGNLVFSGGTAGKASFNMGSSGGTLVLNGGTLPVVGTAGSYTFTSTTNITSTGTSAINYATAISTIGALTVNSGTLTFAAAPTATSVTVASSATLALGANLLTNTGNLTCGSGGSGTATISGSGGITMSAASASMTLAGGAGSACNITNNGLFTISGATAPSFATGSNYSIAGDLSVTNGTATVTNNGSVTIAGTLTLTGNWTQGAADSLSLGAATAIAGAGTFDANSGASNTVTYTAASPTCKVVAYQNLAFTNASGASTVSCAVTTVNGNLTVSTAGTSQAWTLGAALSVGGTFSVGASSTVTTANFTLGVTGATTITGTLSHAGNAALSFADVALNGIVSNTAAGTGTITATGNITGSGTVTLNNATAAGTFIQRVVADKTFGSSSGSNTWSFYHLKFENSNGVLHTITPNAGTGTVQVDGTLTIGNVSDGANTAFDNNTANDRTFDLNGTGANDSINITSKGSFTASNSTSFTIADNFTNSGTFTAPTNSTVTFDTTATAVIAGATTFYNVTSTTSTKIIQFTAGQTFTTNGLVTFTSVSLTSTTGASSWTINHQGTESINSTTISWSACDGSSTNIDAPTSNSNVDGNNNGVCWKFASSITVGGTATTTGTVAMAVNGNLQGQTTTISGGNWTISGVTVNTNDIVTVWVDGAAEASEATGVTKYDGAGNITGMVLNTNVLSIGSADNPSLTFANLGLYDSDNDEDIAHIANGTTFSVGAGYSDATFSILSGATFTMGSSDTLLTDNVSIAGTLTSTTNSAYSITGNWTDTGTFTPATSTVTMSGNSTGRTITTTGSTFYNLSINSSFNGTSVTLQDSTTVSRVLTVALTDTFNAGAGTTLTLSGTTGTPLSISGTFAGGTSTVSFTGNATTTIPAATYHNLTLAPVAGNPTYNFSTGTTTTNNLTIGSGTTMVANANPASITLDINGNLVISNNATFQAPGAGKTLTVGGSYSVGATGGSFVNNSGTITFDATTGGKTIDNQNSTFNTTVFNGVGGAWQVQNANLQANTLTVTAGDLSTSGAGLYISGSVTVNGTISGTNGGTMTIRNDGTSIAGTGSITVSNLSIGDGGDGAATITSTGSGGITITNTLTVRASHIFNAGSRTYTLSKTGTGQITNSGTFNADTSTVRFTGNGATTVSNAVTYNNLQVYPGGASVTHTLPATLTVNGNLDLGGNSNPASTVITAATNNTAMTVKGNITLCAATCSNQMTYTKGSGTLTWSPTGTDTWTDNNPTTQQDLGTISITGGTSTPRINLGSSVVATTITTVAASHELSLNGSNTLTLTGTTGTPLSVAGTFTASTGTVAYTGNNGAGNTTIANVSYYDLTLNNASEQFNMPSTGTITDDLTITAGTFLSSSGTLTISDDFTNNGTFSHNSGTVTFTGAVIHDIGGSSSTAFNNFTNTTAGSTLRFKSHTANVPLYDVAGTFTVTGTNGNNITITSDNGSSKWLVDFASAQSSVTYATISYSGCLTSANVTLDATSTDGTNNDSCWVFPAAGISISGTATTTGTVAVAVNGSLQGQTTTIGGGTWTITGVTAPSTNDVVTVFVNGAADAAESTAVTKYDGTGNITGMVLNTNVLTIGSADNPSVTVTNLGLYDFDQDEDIMHSANASALLVQGGTNSYSDETISVLASATLTIGSSESLTTDNLTNAGTLTSTTTAAYTVSGDWTNSSTFTPATSTVTFTATDTSHTINNGASSFNNVIFNGSGGGWAPLTNAMTLSGDLTMTAGTLSGTLGVTVNGGDVTGDGTINLSSGTFTVDGASGTGFGGATAWTFNNLTFTGASSTTTATGAGGITVSTVLTIGGSHTLDAKGKTWTLSGTTGAPLVITGTLDDTANTSTFTFTGNNGGGSTAIPSSAAYNNITLNASETFTMTGDLTLSGDLTVTTGTLADTDNVTVNGGDATGAGTITLTGGTFLLDTTGNFGGATAWTFNNLTFGDGSGPTTSTSTGAGGVTVSNVLTIAASQTLDAKGKTWTLSGTTGAPLVITGTLDDTANTSTFTFTGNNGGGSTAIPSSAAYNNITLNASETFTMTGDLTLSGDLTVTTGTLADTDNVTVNGGDATGAGTITLTGGTFLLDGTGSFGSAADWTFAGLTFGDGTGVTTTTSTGAGGITVTGVQTIAANQALNAGSKTWTLSGTGTPLAISGTFAPATSTVVYTGTTATVAATTFNTLTLGGTGTYTLPGSSWTVGGDLSITSGATLSVGAGTLTLSPTGTKTVTDNNGTKQNLGNVAISGGSSTPVVSMGSSLTMTSLSIAASHEFDTAAGNTLILTGTGTPLSNAGTFRYRTSTVRYTGNGATNIAAANMSNASGGTNGYYNLQIYPAGATAHTLGTAASQAIGLANNLTIGDAVNAGATGATNNPDLTIGGVLTIATAATLTTGSGTYTLTGTGTPISRSGTLTASTGNTVTYTSGSGITALSSAAMTGSNTFYNLTINGTGTFTAGVDFDVGNDLTVTSGTLAGTPSTTVSGNFTGAGTVTLTGGTLTMSSTTSKNLGGANPWTFYNLTGSGASGTTTATGAGGITVSNVLTNGANHTLDAGSKTWTLSGTTGTPFVNNGTFTPSTSTVTFTGNNAGGNTTVPAVTYNHLTLNNASETYVLAGATTLNNDLTITAGTLDTVNLQDYALNVGGNWSNAGTFTPRSGTVTFTATSGTKTINNGASSFYDLVFNGSGGTFQPSTNALTVANVLTVTAGTLSGTLNITVGGGDATGNGTINMTGGTFLIDGDTSSGFGGSTPWTFYNLTFGDGVGTSSSTFSGALITVTNVLTVSANHDVSNEGTNFTLSGTGTPFVRTGSWVNDASTTFAYTSGSGVTALSSAAMTGSNAFPNLVINGTGTFTAGVAIEAKNSLTVSGGTLAMGTNTLTVGNSAVTNSGSIKVASGQSLTQSSAGTTTILTSSSGANCVGSNGASCAGTQGTITFGNLTIGNGSTTMTTTLGATTPAVTVAGTLNITTNSTFAAGTGSTITLSGTGTPVTRSGTFTAGTSTLAFTSGAGTSGLFSAAMTGSNALYNLTINGTGTFTAGASALEVGNTLAVTSGTLDLNTNDPILDGNGSVTIGASGTLSASNSASFTIAGNFTNAGTFTHNGGTVVFDTTGISIISSTASISFNNFTSTAAGKTIKFQKHTASTPVFTFAGTFTLTGANGNNIFLQSDTPSSQWLASFTLPQSAVTYVTMTDCGCSSSQNVAVSQTNINNGNNGSCWLFAASSIFSGGSTSSLEGGSGGGTPSSGGTGQGGSGGGADGGSSGGGSGQSGGGAGGGGGGASP